MDLCTKLLLTSVLSNLTGAAYDYDFGAFCGREYIRVDTAVRHSYNTQNIPGSHRVYPTEVHSVHPPSISCLPSLLHHRQSHRTNSGVSPVLQGIHGLHRRPRLRRRPRRYVRAYTSVSACVRAHMMCAWLFDWCVSLCVFVCAYICMYVRLSTCLSNSHLLSSSVCVYE